MVTELKSGGYIMDRIEVRRAGLRDREKRYYLNILPVLSLLRDYMFDYEVIGRKGDMPIIKVKVGEVSDFYEAIAEFVIAEDNLEDCYAAVERELRSIDIRKFFEKESSVYTGVDIVLDCISALQIRRHNKELLAKADDMRRHLTYLEKCWGYQSHEYFEYEETWTPDCNTCFYHDYCVDDDRPSTYVLTYAINKEVTFAHKILDYVEKEGVCEIIC